MKTKRIQIVAMLVLTWSPATIATAAIKNWTDGTGNWSVGANWSGGTVPAGSDTVNIVFTDGVARTVTYDVNAPSLGLLSIDLTGAGTAASTLSMPSNFNLTAAAIAVGGYNGSAFTNGRGAVNQSAGTTTISPGVDLILAWGSGSTGTYNLSGGDLVANQSEWVGYAGIGTFNHTAGTNTINANGVGDLFVGYDAAATGTYNLSGTGELLSDEAEYIGYSGDGYFNQTGGSNYIFGAGNNLYLGYNIGSTGTYTLSGGTLSVGQTLVVGDFGSGQLEITNGGIVTSGVGIIAFNNASTGTVTVSGPGSAWNVSDELYVNYFSAGGSAVLNIRDGGLVSVADDLLLDDAGVVNLDGGTIRFDGYNRNNFGGGNGGIFNFNAGTIQLVGDRTIGTDAAILDILGAAPTLAPGKGLAVEGTAMLLTTVTIDGGTFSTGQLVSASLLDLRRGTFNLTNQAVTIGSGGLLGSTLDVNEDTTVNVTLGITNHGLVTGDGQIGGTFANAAAGELRAQAGRSLRLTGSGNTNAGQIKLLGGELEFTQNLTNSAGAFISGNGSLIVGGGLVNQGTMNFAGTANIDGSVTNASGGKIISGGGGATIFYDDVVNNGEIRTSTNGFTVFFGAVSGSGTFTGTGTVNFEGDLSPGSSPAAVSFGGNATFASSSSLNIELGGITPGSQYDQLLVSGALSLGGALDVTLINGFTPSAGQAFNILDWGSLAGTFSSITLPTLAGLSWNTSQLYTTGMLSVAIPGDFNLDGTFDAADYIVWRKTGGSADDYNTWRANFGQPSGSGSGAIANVTVPEPASLVLVMLAAVGWPLRRRRAA